jgi:predicted amidohydrolase
LCGRARQRLALVSSVYRWSEAEPVLSHTFRHLQAAPAAGAAAQPPPQYDTIIRNGRVICPASGLDDVCDIAIKDGRIAARGRELPGAAAEVFDASGLLVTPGLIDIHTHIYHLRTPLGLPPDEYCLSRGVTTAVDAGSAGATTVAGLKSFIADQVRTRVLCFINASMHGLSAAWGSPAAAPALARWIA